MILFCRTQFSYFDACTRSTPLDHVTRQQNNTAVMDVFHRALLDLFLGVVVLA
jgi:hypothetical protein